jgi:hypothetical protein
VLKAGAFEGCLETTLAEILGRNSTHMENHHEEFFATIH